MSKLNTKAKIQEQIIKEFEQNPWMRFCKKHNINLYNKELRKVVNARFLGLGWHKNSFGKTYKGHKIARGNRKNFFYGS